MKQTQTVDEDEEVCGSDGITYSSLCRILLELDDVYVKYDGPCNQTECVDAEVNVDNKALSRVNIYTTFLHTYSVCTFNIDILNSP